jgi:hypothetical protein
MGRRRRQGRKENVPNLSLQKQDEGDIEKQPNVLVVEEEVRLATGAYDAG